MIDDFIVADSPIMEAALERQLEELSVLAAMYAGENEFQPDTSAMSIAHAILDGALPSTEALELAAMIMLTLDGGGARASMSVNLPLSYPNAAAARFEFSCVALTSSAIEKVNLALANVATQAACEQREALVELCLTAQQQAEELLLEAAACTPTPPRCQPHQPPEQSNHRIIIWFHHVKSLQKRKEIVARARSGRLRGFCKPGFPGVVVAEGPSSGCADFVAAIRSLKWQAMDLRLDEEAAPSTGLPQPFIELSESDMGEAAALCRAAGILNEFKQTVLKLESPGSHLLSDGDVHATPVAAAAAAAAAAADTSLGEVADTLEAVLAIDHMNDRAGYTRLLARWTQQLLSGGRLLYAVGGGRQARNLVLVLHGTRDGIKAFVQQLRTEKVDVNRAGRPCKERQATVVQQGMALAQGRSVLSGWSICQYAEASALQRELFTLGVADSVVSSVLGDHQDDAHISSAIPAPSRSVV